MQEPQQTEDDNFIDSSQWKEARDELRCHGSYKFVTPKEFAALAISNARLVRLDLRESNLKGLRDADSGVCYVVEVERLPTDRTW